MILWNILIFPLMGWVINGLVHLSVKKNSLFFSSYTAILMLLLSFLHALYATLILSQSVDHPILESSLGNWVYIDTLMIDATLRLDPLSSIFVLVITGVGLLIHIYASQYMSDDPTPGRFFSYLNLFCFFMLLLVMSSNMVWLFIGWEGVGIMSALLISYNFEDPAKTLAGWKAFVVNRVGDIAFLLGMFCIWHHLKTLDFVEMQKFLYLEQQPSWVALAYGLIFLGCTAKSAQIPLYFWLPEAMAGPTPVSALIHAATMVTSGIYVLNRVSFFSPHACSVTMAIAWIGALTALLAAAVACFQVDIKKVLAYSTVSQLGFMFLACGAQSPSSAVFHVITHAFFKALLFLGAGNVIHAMESLDHGKDPQDIRWMGGLGSRLPITMWTFGIAVLAITGFPGLSGFFSKDEILWSAFAIKAYAPWALALIASWCTSFYMTKLFTLVFLGAPRWSSQHIPHEAPPKMTLPLMVLAFASATAGVLGIPGFHILHSWLKVAEHHPDSLLWEIALALITASTTMLVIWYSAWLHLRKPPQEDLMPHGGYLATQCIRILEKEWYVPYALDYGLAPLCKKLFQNMLILWESALLLPVYNLGADGISRGGSFFQNLQRGSITFYLKAFGLSLLICIGAFLFYALFP